MATPTDTTPLLGGIGLARGDGRVRAAVAACCALAVAACVVYLGARERASGLLSQWYSDVVNVCPPVPPRAWSEMPEEGSAHMLLLGDSTDKLWIIEMCSDILPPEQQCRFIGADKRALDISVPQNLQPFACVNGDSRCRAATCFPGDGTSCYIKYEWRTNAACKPLDPHASTLGFVHIPDTDQDFDLDKQPFDTSVYSTAALSSKVGERVVQAVEHFADFTETRPIVVSLDVMFWWNTVRFMGLGNTVIRDPDYVTANWDAILDQYREGILGLVDIIQRALREKNRPGIIVGKANHRPAYPDGSLELKQFLAMREVLFDIFERDPSHAEKGLYMYDWYAVSEQAVAEGVWELMDPFHQTYPCSRYETEAYRNWVARTLPNEFRPVLW